MKQFLLVALLVSLILCTGESQSTLKRKEIEHNQDQVAKVVKIEPSIEPENSESDPIQSLVLSLKKEVDVQQVASKLEELLELMVDQESRQKVLKSFGGVTRIFMFAKRYKMNSDVITKLLCIIVDLASDASVHLLEDIEFEIFALAKFLNHHKSSAVTVSKIFEIFNALVRSNHKVAKEILERVAIEDLKHIIGSREIVLKSALPFIVNCLSDDQTLNSKVLEEFPVNELVAGIKDHDKARDLSKVILSTALTPQQRSQFIERFTLDYLIEMFHNDQEVLGLLFNNEYENPQNLLDRLPINFLVNAITQYEGNTPIVSNLMDLLASRMNSAEDCAHLSEQILDTILQQHHMIESIAEQVLLLSRHCKLKLANEQLLSIVLQHNANPEIVSVALKIRLSQSTEESLLDQLLWLTKPGMITLGSRYEIIARTIIANSLELVKSDIQYLPHVLQAVHTCWFTSFIDSYMNEKEIVHSGLSLLVLVAKNVRESHGEIIQNLPFSRITMTFHKDPLIITEMLELLGLVAQNTEDHDHLLRVAPLTELVYVADRYSNDSVLSHLFILYISMLAPNKPYHVLEALPIRKLSRRLRDSSHKVSFEIIHLCVLLASKNVEVAGAISKAILFETILDMISRSNLPNVIEDGLQLIALTAHVENPKNFVTFRKTLDLILDNRNNKNIVRSGLLILKHFSKIRELSFKKLISNAFSLLDQYKDDNDVVMDCFDLVHEITIKEPLFWSNVAENFLTFDILGSIIQNADLAKIGLSIVRNVLSDGARGDLKKLEGLFGTGGAKLLIENACNVVKTYKHNPSLVEKGLLVIGKVLYYQTDPVLFECFSIDVLVGLVNAFEGNRHIVSTSFRIIRKFVETGQDFDKVRILNELDLQYFKGLRFHKDVAEEAKLLLASLSKSQKK